MSDVKKVNRQFLFTLIGFFVLIGMIGFSMILINIFIENESIAYAIYFALLIVLLFIIPMFKNQFDRLINLSYLVKIRHHAANPLEMNYSKDKDSFINRIKSLGYQRFAFDKYHAIYYRVSKDNIKRIFRRYMLEVVVILEKTSDEFYLTVVDDEISMIQQKHLKEHQKMDRMLITQIMEIDNLEDETKEKIKEILFIRAQQTIISTINIGLHKPTQTALMLYSDTYSPSLYYKHHIHEIKNMI